MTLLSSPEENRPQLNCALTGANGAYGRTLLSQLGAVPKIAPVVLVDPDVDGVCRSLRALERGNNRRAVKVVEDASRAADVIRAGSIALMEDATAIPWTLLDVLVEASGKVGPGCHYAHTALSNDVHVVMVSKEVDTVAGPALGRQAEISGVSYRLADGDQPANLLRLAEWIAEVGLEIVALGKAGEHDLLFDPSTQTLNHDGVTLEAHGFTELLTLGDNPIATLTARAAGAASLKRTAAADYCEMAAVAHRLGVGTDVGQMHYPIVRIDEIADVYARREHGGLMGPSLCLDVFTALRLPGEASIAGGVFAVVRTTDPFTWSLLRSKGHVVSQDGRYACVYWPYHLMGVETPLTVFAAADRRPTHTPRATALLAARANKDLKKGTVLRVAGHHHEIHGVDPVLIKPEPHLTTYYLLDGVRLTRDLAAGQLVSEGDVSGIEPLALSLHRAGRTQDLS